MKYEKGDLPISTLSHICNQYPQWGITYRHITSIDVWQNVALVSWEKLGKKYRRFINKKMLLVNVPSDGDYVVWEGSTGARNEANVKRDGSLLIITYKKTGKKVAYSTHGDYLDSYTINFTPVSYRPLGVKSRPKHVRCHAY